MGQITPEFLFDVESNMRVISAREYERLVSKLWWPLIAKKLDSQSKAERLIWLLDTAKIERVERGQMPFEDIVAQTTEFENESAAAGLELQREQFEDIFNGRKGGEGIDLATHWARQMGIYAAYWPQKMVAAAIRANPTTYDGLAFFHASHPVNPFDTSAGTFANLFTGAPSGSYPGACPIDTSVTVDAAVTNLAKVIAYVGAMKLPNGEDPRFLRVAHIFHPPALTARAQQITNAKFIAQAAGSAAGSGDVSAVIANFGLGQPVEVPEFAAAFGGSDVDYYLGMEEVGGELGAFVYLDRDPFSIVYHGELTDAELARKAALQWTNRGRNVVGAGHPYKLMKVKGT